MASASNSIVRMLPLRKLLSASPLSTISKRLYQKNLGIIGVPFCHGQAKSGADKGPETIRAGNLVKKMNSLEWNVKDYGNLDMNELPSPNVGHPSVKNSRLVGSVLRRVSHAVQQLLSDNDMLVVLGGDHSIGCGSVHGHMMREPRCCVIWVDAHADINTPHTSFSGNAHGMPLSFLIPVLQQYVGRIDGFEWVRPCLSHHSLAYIGLRDVDPGERYIMESLGIKNYSMGEVDRYGISRVLEEILDSINARGDKSIHLSFDIDSLDPIFAPSTGTAVPGGLNLREGLYIAEELSETGMLRVVDMVEVNPNLGNEAQNAMTVNSAISVLMSCCGQRRRGTVPSKYALPKPAEEPIEVGAESASS